jgi:dTDP-4-amino-4,6-dideoxygalactose transaminase/intein/homing endonuclease
MIKQIQPFIGEEEARAAYETILSTQLSEGPKTEEFEKRIREYTGYKYAIAVSNWTDGLILCIETMKRVHRKLFGRELHTIIIPDITFVASLNAAIFCGLKPIILDVDENFQLDPNRCESILRDYNVDCIMPVDLYGGCPDLEAFQMLSKKYNVSIIEDVAQAMGAKYNNRHLGAYCNNSIGGFSFYANKLITCFPPKTKIVTKKDKHRRIYTKSIEDLKVGDAVLSFNSKTSQKEYKKITRKFKRKINEKILSIKFDNGNRLDTTKNHPIYVVDKGWISADKLNIGDEVIQYNYFGLSSRINFLKNFNIFKGNTYEDIMGKERAKKRKQDHSNKIKKIHNTENNNYDKMYLKKDWRLAISKANKGKKRTKDQREKMSLRQKLLYEDYPELKTDISMKNKENWSNLTKKEKETRVTQLQTSFNSWWSRIKKDPVKYKEIMKLYSNRSKKMWKTSKILGSYEYYKKVFDYKINKINKSESKLFEIIEETCPKEFVFNGNCEKKLIINRKIPDFVNVNGKNKVIELFGQYWHKKIDEKNRIKLFKKHGYDCLIIWDNELKNTEIVKSKIRNFLYNPNTKIIKVISIEEKQYNGYVYNIEVEKNNNYFAQGILVHNCGEGGALVTNNEEMYSIANSIKQHGGKRGTFEHEMIGFNFRFDDIRASIAIEQLKKIDEILVKRQQLFNLYKEKITLDVFKFTDRQISSNSWFINVKCPEVLVDDQYVSASHFQRLLKEKGIETRRIFKPLHMQKCYQQYPDLFEYYNDGEHFCYDYVSTRLYDRYLSLPSHYLLTKQEVETVINTVNELGEKYGR